MMKQFLENSILYGANAPFVEDLYEKYLKTRIQFLANGAAISNRYSKL